MDFRKKWECHVDVEIDEIQLILLSFFNNYCINYVIMNWFHSVNQKFVKSARHAC